MLDWGCRGSVTPLSVCAAMLPFNVEWALPTVGFGGRCPPYTINTESLIARAIHAEARDEVGAGAAGHGEQLAAAGDAQALVERLDVVVDGVLGQVQLVGDFFFAAALHQLCQCLLKSR